MSSDQTKLLAHAVPGGPAQASQGVVVHVGYFERDSGDFHEIGTSTSWQMGSRLRWHPEHRNSRVLFNALDDDHHATYAYDLVTQSIVSKYPLAFYDVAENGGYAIALNYSHLGRLRLGYGYVDLPDSTSGNSAPSDDGLWRVELDSGDTSLLVTFRDLLALRHHESMDSADHYINLVMVSPTGKNIAFLHLWIDPHSSAMYGSWGWGSREAI